jgi:hypothetical protein
VKAPITVGDLVIFRAGDGSSALSSAATPIFLDEYTAAGSLVQSIAVPTSVSGANFAITCAGSSASEGQITKSVNGQYVLFTGYNAASGTAAISATTAAATNRVVGLLDIVTGAVNSSTALNDFASAGSPRCATSTNGTDIWVCGSNSGVRYTTLGATTSTQLSTTPTNVRTVNIFTNQLFITAASATFQGISAVGTGMPTTVGQTIVPLPGFPTTAGPSPYSFSIKPTTADVAYVADDRTIALGGGIQKWILSAGTWGLAYILNNGLTAGVRGLAIDWSGANPVLYGTTADASSKLIKITDVGGLSLATTLTTAATNTAFRGIAFVGTNVSLPIRLDNFGVYNYGNYTKINWSNLTEFNVINYVIERSVNGINFTTINTVGATKNNNNQADYEVLDSFPVNGNNFYRIRCNEIGGKFLYSNTMKANIKKDYVAFNIYPNPVSSNQFFYQASSLPKGVYTLDLINMEGKKLFSRMINHPGGAFSKSIQLPVNANSGLYILHLTGNKINSTEQILIK